jgi:hypothetical protein
MEHDATPGRRIGDHKQVALRRRRRTNPHLAIGPPLKSRAYPHTHVCYSRDKALPHQALLSDDQKNWVIGSKQRLGPVATTMKSEHWVCEEIDQQFAGYSIYGSIQNIVCVLRTGKCHGVFVNSPLDRR